MENKAYSAAHLCGSTRNKMKKRVAPKHTDSSSKPKVVYVTYCPHCEDNQQPDGFNRFPQRRNRSYANRGKMAKCKNGHTWRVV